MIEPTHRCTKSRGKIYWRILTYATVVLPVLVGLVELYDSAGGISNAITNRGTLSTRHKGVISPRSLDDIDRFIKSNSKVVGITAFTVDLQKNTRRVLLTRLSGDESVQPPPTYPSGDIAEYPLFTTDPGTMNTLSIALLNGSFVCFSVEDSTIYTYQPQVLPNKVTTACSIAIPPIYGKFAGVLTAYTVASPSVIETDAIQMGLKNLSATIYHRDLR